MDEKQVAVLNAVKVFFLAIFLLVGCSTTNKKVSVSVPKQDTRKQLASDVLVFRDLQQIDLDRDGVDEIVAIYTTKTNSNGVKVIKINNNQGDIIFTRIIDTPNIKLEVQSGIPTIVSKGIDYTTGRSLIRIYRWDGKAFSFE